MIFGPHSKNQYLNLGNLLFSLASLRQKTVVAHFKCKQIQLFAFTSHHTTMSPNDIRTILLANRMSLQHTHFAAKMYRRISALFGCRVYLPSPAIFGHEMRLSQLFICDPELVRCGDGLSEAGTSLEIRAVKLRQMTDFIDLIEALRWG